MVYIGIDLGGTNIAAGVVDEQGNILHQGCCPTLVERGYAPVIADMAKLALQVLAEGGYSLDDLAAVGIGVPGIAYPDTGVVPFCTNLFWHNVPLKELMQSYIDKPVYIGNDATVAGLAESVAGISKGCQDSVFLTLGTGVGGGIVINGKVYSGPHGVGSELGHMIIVADGEECTCGNFGCWERYASATALIRMGKATVEVHPDSLILKNAGGDASAISAKNVIDAAKSGDAAAAEVFAKYVHYLAVGIINIINFTDPEVIALGGGVSHAGEFLVEAVRAEVAKMVFYKTMPYARIELAVLGNSAGIIGAAMLGK